MFALGADGVKSSNLQDHRKPSIKNESRPLDFILAWQYRKSETKLPKMDLTEMDLNEITDQDLDEMTKRDLNEMTEKINEITKRDLKGLSEKDLNEMNAKLNEKEPENTDNYS